MNTHTDILVSSAFKDYWRHTPDIAFIKDLSGVYVASSYPFARVTGREHPKDVVGKTDAELFADPELVKRYLDDDARLLEEGESLIDYVEPIPSENSKPRYCLTSKRLLRDDNGEIIGLLGVARDITVEYEAKLSYENELKSLFVLPKDALVAVLFDITAWRVVDARQHPDKPPIVAGYGQIDDYLNNVLTVIVEGDEAREYFKNFTKEALESMYDSGARSRSFEYLRRMPDGTEKWVRSDNHILIDPINGSLSVIIVVRDIDSEKREYANLRQAAERDSITRLLNRDAAFKQIESYLDTAEGMQALFMADLDNFKQVNDTFGHQQGDIFLEQVSEALRSVFRDSDIIGRIGGDEFMVLMKDVKTTGTAIRKAGELISALQFSSGMSQTNMELTVSVGLTVFTAGERDFTTLYGEADAALYESKRKGKNRFSLYTEGLPEGSCESIPVFENINTVQLRTLLEYMDGGMVLFEVTDNVSITYVSPSLYRSFGIDQNDPSQSGQNIFNLILPEDRAELRSALFKAVENDEPLDFNYRAIRPGGKVAWRRLRAKRIPGGDDGVCRMVSVITDITDLKHANESLRETEERYRMAVEQTDALLWETDLNTRVMTLSGTGWEKLSGDEHVFPDMPGGYLRTNAIHPDSMDEFVRMFTDIFAGSKSDEYYIRINSSYEDLWVKAQYSLLYNENGVPYCALGTTQFVPNISAEMRRFNQEMRFESIVHDALLGFIRVNLTKNRVDGARMFDDGGNELYSGQVYDDFHRHTCEKFVYPDDAPEFGRITSREYLIERFQERESWRFSDFRRLTESGEARWTCQFTKLLRHPISGDIYSFSYIRDNDACRRWELELNEPLQRNATLMLYTRDSMRRISEHIISQCPEDSLIAVTVIGITGLEEVRARIGDAEVGSLMFAFGRLCRIAISGNVIVGQLDENRIALLRPDAGSSDKQRERVLSRLSMIKELLRQSHPDANVNLMGGFATGTVKDETYDRLLGKADLACLSAEQTLGDAIVGYADMGVELPMNDSETVPAQLYRALEMRYQQQALVLRFSECDELTGILGKHAFYRRVRELLDQNPDTSYVLVRFDINRFKVYNDICGVEAGDKLLKGIGALLRHETEASDNCARLESDHFVLIIRDDEEAVLRFKDSLCSWLERFSEDFRLTVTIGVYRILDPSIEVSLMCDRALLALREVKSGFDTKMCYYDDALRDKLLEEQRLVGDMEQAIRDEQFILHFQPQINYESGELVGAEALVRWNHPTRGLLYPNKFITLFERNGLITKLDEYVWERCCRYISQWTKQYPYREKLAVSVNVSRLDIYDNKLVQTLEALVRKYEIPTTSLHLEITESAYMENPRQLIDTVERLQSAGFIVEMDDFGSGYSSLNTLKDVNVDILKLDMNFLRNCAGSARGGNILSSVIRMAHWLKLPIIAEGVEQRPQADYLKSLGCIYMQGYYFDRPMPADSFVTLLDRGASAITERYSQASVEGMAAFWDPSAQVALLFNSFVGGAAIIEYRNGVLEASRVNDNFYKTLGTTREKYLPLQRDLMARFDEENKKKLLTQLNRAIETGEECGCELCSLPRDGVEGVWTSNRVRLLAKSEDSAILYMTIMNISERKKLELEREVDMERTRLLMQTTGSGLFEYDYAGDTMTYMISNKEDGLTRHVVSDFLRGSALRDMLLHPCSMPKVKAIIESAAHGHVDGEIEVRINLWGNGMRWWRIQYSSVEDSEGKAYRIMAQGNDIQSIKDRAALSEAFRLRLNMGHQIRAYNSDVVNQIFNLFYETSNISKAIDTTLSLIGEYFNLSRAYLCEDREEHTISENTFLWRAKDTDAFEPFKKSIVYADYGIWGGYKRFFVNDVLYCPDVSKLPESVREILDPFGTKAMLQCAIMDEGAFLGMIGYDLCRENQSWTEEQIGTLLFVSRIIASNLVRLRKLNNADFSADFKAALDNNAEFTYIIDPETYEVIYNNKAIHDYLGEDYIGKVCYKEFMGKETPCEDCPLKALKANGRTKPVRVERPDGLKLLTHASPLRWNGRDMIMISCVDTTLIN